MQIPWDIKTHEIEQWIPESIRKLPDELAPISILCNRSVLPLGFFELRNPTDLREGSQLDRMAGLSICATSSFLPSKKRRSS